MRNAPSIDDQLEMYRRMVVVRHMEETLGALHKAGRTRGPIHRCDGQEAVGIGATAVLSDEDFITSTHRGHAHYIGKGLDPHRVIAEILGRETGYCRGRAGHMIVADASKGMIGGNAIVGAGIPAATGMACSIKLRKLDSVAMCLFGDGAAQTGICHESMNIAALWKLPVVFLLEHNQYGLTAHSSRQSSVEDLHVRAQGYGMPGVMIDGNDVVEVYRTVQDAVARARRGEGPTLVEAKTYRLTGFSTSDVGGYQSDDEIRQWREKDPLGRAFAMLESEVGEERLSKLRDDARRSVDEAFEQAFADPFPEFALHPASAPYTESAR